MPVAGACGEGSGQVITDHRQWQKPLGGTAPRRRDVIPLAEGRRADGTGAAWLPRLLWVPQ